MASVKKRLLDDGNETVTNCNALKMPAPDGKMRLTDVADTEQLFRLIRSIPSPKAESFMDGTGGQGTVRSNARPGIVNPAGHDGLQAVGVFIYKTWAGKMAKEYKQFKGLKKENLWDNMTNKGLVLNMLAELSTKEISEVQGPESFKEHMDVAQQGGTIALNARLELERKTGKPVVTVGK